MAKRIKVGIIGGGSFGTAFTGLFRAHPNVRDVALAEVMPERRAEVAARHGIGETYGSVEEICASDVDAVAIFTQRHLHGPQAIAALEAGKHVYCAVPLAPSLEEIDRIVALVTQTGLTYMTGETSYYYPSALYCRARWRAGDFGDFVYGEGEYLHDMSHGFYDAFRHSGGDEWKRVAGFPPMYYPTHSTSMIVSVTGARLTHVSCLGYVDRSDDGVFGTGNNLWDNPYSNQTALFRTSDGGMCRINEFRRIGVRDGNSVRTSLYGTLGAYEEQGKALRWTTLEGGSTDLGEALACGRRATDRPRALTGGEQEDFFSGVSSVHPVERLPREFAGLPNGHYGSHQFLVDDFLRAVVQDRLPPNHVWAATRYTVGGLIAHESALRDGELLPIPDFGDPPAGSGEIGYDPY